MQAILRESHRARSRDAAGVRICEARALSAEYEMSLDRDRERTNTSLETTARALELSVGQLGKIMRMFEESPRVARLPVGQRDAARAALRAALFKFELAHVHLENIWQIRETIGLELLLDNSVENHAWDNATSTLGSLHLEGFLYQARAFLDATMLHGVLALGVSFRGSMSLKAFKKVVDPGSDRRPAHAEELHRLFFGEGGVFATDAWGSLLRALRDRVAHGRDFTPGDESSERVGVVTLDWPTLRGQTFHALAQSFQNDAFGLLCDLVPVLYGTPWKPGA